ncbi:MAG TPA: hypothetical protein VFJ82_20965 [Longimicrobium sp.]|nr:hypothetical protein [Longimicrobium sp.]
MPRPNRTVRKPTRWTPEEWRSVEDAARARGIPPLRFVREAALERARPGSAPTRLPTRRAGDELAHQFADVLNNLRQLQRVAEDDGNDEAAARIGEVIDMTEMALATAPERAREAEPMIAAVIQAGIALNEVAHRANAAKCLPPLREVMEALASVETLVTSPAS